MKAINKQCSELMSRSGELLRDPDSKRDAKLMEQAVNTIAGLKDKNITLELENTKLHSQNKTETFEENFYWSVAWYNGYEEEFDKVLNYLKERQKPIKENELYFEIPRPDFITSEDSIMELYWMLLVQDFGSYGISPRFGWINRNKLNNCINHITEMINKTYGEGR